MAATYPPRMPSGGSRRTSPIRARSEPGKIPAALLALIVHAGFFAVVVLGVSWQVKHPTPVVAELWDQLPPLQNVPDAVVPPAPPPEPEPEIKKIEPPPVAKPVVEQTSKADIQLKAKKEKAEREKIEQEKAEKLKQAEAEKKRKEDEAKKKATKAAEDKAKAEQASREAAATAARNSDLQAYAGKISALIHNRANIPDSVNGNPEITVRLRLLVNGAVLDAQVVKPSGNRVYDEAVERAVNGIQNWPLPQNPDVLGGRRELILNIRHER